MHKKIMYKKNKTIFLMLTGQFDIIAYGFKHSSLLDQSP